MDFHHLGNNIGFRNILVPPTDWDLSGHENNWLCFLFAYDTFHKNNDNVS